ncbi:unnamed protein product [Cylicocyclus nassatus]|uniref:Uncharacterized protein n=1 Tax=Cylicocyclus nassatus TaxID=53992 RepID=A0AA36MB21_CYLNA|nr:unnamed protein product [Cylicocyclus nassatus]
MEELSSYSEQFNQARPLLSIWCDHLVKVEMELRKLAQKFDDWDVETKSAAIDPTAANVADSANGLSCVIESSCSGSIQDLISNTIELLEQDTMLTENLTEIIELLKEKQALVQETFYEFDDNHDIVLPHDNASTKALRYTVRLPAMEELSSYAEQFNQARPLLTQWCDHLVKVEVELRKLAQKFDDWDVETKSVTSDPAAANVADSANGLSCVIESSCSGSIQDLISNTIELFEQDTILTENLTEIIELLKEKQALVQEKFYEFDDNHDILLPHDNASIAVARLFNLSNQSASLGVLEITVYTKFSFHLTEVIKNITNLAFEGSQSLALVALQLHSIADMVGKWRFVRCEIVELVGRCIQIGTCLSIIHLSATY